MLVLALIGAVALGFVMYVPYGPHAETFVRILPGTGSTGIASKLEQAGVVRSRYGFDILREIKGGTLKAGEYRFDHPATMGEVYARLHRGDVYTVAVSIPEGFNLFEIATAVQAAGLGSATDFLTAARQNTALIAEWSPEAQSLEGYLFPETYRFGRHTTHLEILMAMVKRFKQAKEELGLTGDVARTVTMASLVEKEVKQDNERPLVAGVFENRLRVGMPLATDPTVIYAALLEGRSEGPGVKTTIFASDLKADSAYNTYKHTGLPPGPICSPGLASLRAAMHPAKTDFLYFVSDAAGHSKFSVDLKEHASQVQAYRQAQRR